MKNASKPASKRLAKNTVYMYARMIVLMLISLYTSRIVLRELGIDDYGLYNVVGSVVAMFGALRGIFATSTQRFLNFEMGKGANNRLQLVFNIGSYVNILLAFVFIAAVEVVGYWFLNYKINIDPSRIIAAKWVFQLSVISAAINMITAPLDAVIIAHERMDYYAIMAILEGVLKLAIVFSLPLFIFDRLILYAWLLLAVTLLIRIVNALYCYKYFPESHLKRCWDKRLFKEMSVFAGWNFFGNMAYTVTDSGLNMVLNIFGGPTVNAARGVAYQVKSATMKFMDAMVTVISPYNTKLYASGQRNKFFDMLHLSTKIYFIVQISMVIPLTYFTNDFLSIWLRQVPEYAIVFTQLILIHSLIRAIHYPINNLFKSSGNLKAYQITEGVVLSLPLLFSYIALKSGSPFYVLFLIVIVFEVINFVAIVYIAHRILGLSVRHYIVGTVSPCLACFLIALIGFFIKQTLSDNALSLGLSIMVLLIILVMMFFVGLSATERNCILTIFNRIKRA